MKAILLGLVTLFCAYSLSASECGWCAELSLDGLAHHEPTDLKLSWSKGEAETNKVDVLFVFDESARAWLADYNIAVTDFVNEVLLEMNTSLALTGINDFFTFRSAGTFDVGTDLSSWRITMVCLYASGKMKKESLEPYFVPMREFRDETAADIVVVLTAPQDTSNYGATVALTSDYFSVGGMTTYAEYAYSIVDIRTTFSRYTILHEIGHIFGAGHANTQSSSPGPQLRSYSSGYLFSVGDTNYATIMGYIQVDTDGKYHRERLPFFSSPDYALDGVPVGTHDKNDNTRTLCETFKYVSNFRVKEHTPISPVIVDDGISLYVRDGDDATVEEGETIRISQFENVEFHVSAENPTGVKTTIKVTGLPTGMKYSSKTGKISGYAKKSGAYSVTVKATAKGKTPAVRKFMLSVAAMPDAVIGSYVGIVSSSATGDVLVTATLSKTGRITVKMRYAGSNRTFSCNGFDGVDNGVWSASPLAKINRVARTLDIAFYSDGRSMTIAGFSGCLLQNVWGRKDISAPVFKKAVQGSAGDFTVRLYGKGKVKFSGKIGGIGVSGTFQLVSGTPEDGYSRGEWSLPVAFAAKRNFPGWTGWLAVDLEVDSSNRVIGATVEAPENL